MYFFYVIMCTFFHTTRDGPGQQHTFLSYPDITAWQCCNTILPIQSTHDVKLSSLGAPITGWSVRHLHSLDIRKLQRHGKQLLRDSPLRQQQTDAYARKTGFNCKVRCLKY